MIHLNQPSFSLQATTTIPISDIATKTKTTNSEGRCLRRLSRCCSIIGIGLAMNSSSMTASIPVSYPNMIPALVGCGCTDIHLAKDSDRNRHSSVNLGEERIISDRV